jgi:hypothetical protein
MSLSWHMLTYAFTAKLKSCKTTHAKKTLVDKLKHVKLLTPHQKKSDNNIFPPL